MKNKRLIFRPPERTLRAMVHYDLPKLLTTLQVSSVEWHNIRETTRTIVKDDLGVETTYAKHSPDVIQGVVDKAMGSLSLSNDYEENWPVSVYIRRYLFEATRRRTTSQPPVRMSDSARHPPQVTPSLSRIVPAVATMSGSVLRQHASTSRRNRFVPATSRTSKNVAALPTVPPSLDSVHRQIASTSGRTRLVTARVKAPKSAANQNVLVHPSFSNDANHALDTFLSDQCAFDLTHAKVALVSLGIETKKNLTELASMGRESIRRFLQNHKETLNLTHLQLHALEEALVEYMG